MKNIVLEKSMKAISNVDITILYVEDKEDIRKNVSKSLSLIYKNVLTASNKEEAYQIFINYNIDLVITDLHMPHMVGMELIKSIKHISPNLPCIVTLSDSSAHTLLDLITYGINYIIVKPFTIDKLCEEIDKAYKSTYYYKELIKKEQEIDTLSSLLKEQVNELKEMSSQIMEQNSGLEFQYSKSRKNILYELKNLFD